MCNIYLLNKLPLDRHKRRSDKKPAKEVMTGLYSALRYSAAIGVIAAGLVGLLWPWGKQEQSEDVGMASVAEMSHRAVVLRS